MKKEFQKAPKTIFHKKYFYKKPPTHDQLLKHWGNDAEDMCYGIYYVYPICDKWGGNDRYDAISLTNNPEVVKIIRKAIRKIENLNK